MQKDVIYIDTEDNITDIINKVKASDGKVVALVPPKRTGAIQSAVNLKLVHRAAEQANKHLVVVTNNQALMALAGSTGIPIAKNLQSKPEMPDMAPVDAEEDDIIDGSELQNIKKSTPKNAAANDVVDGDNAAEVATEVAPESTSGALAAGKQAAVAPAKSHTKVPDFNRFRKKLFLIIALTLLLIAFLVWAIMFAPHASIVIKAKTSDVALNTKVNINPANTTNLQAGTLKGEVRTSTKDVSVPFTATGKKDAGTKATGSVKFVPASITVIMSGATIPAGTKITSTSGAVYTTDAVAVFDNDLPASTLMKGVSVNVTAAANGASYNGASGSANGPSGFTTTFTSATAGGSDKTLTVVQQSDIDAVSGDVQKTSDSDAAKKDLIAQFGNGYIVINESFKADAGAVTPSPAVGQEASDGKGTLTGKITYSLMAVAKTEADTYLTKYFAQQIDGKTDQKVYGNGNDSVAFTAPVVTKDGYTVTMTANGKIGPNVDEAKMKEYAKGKKAGEIKVYAEAINGVQSADVTFSPFWVTHAPNDVNKIKVQFNVNGN